MPDTITVSMSSHQNRSGIIVLSGDWSGRMRPHPVLHSRAWPGRAREGQPGFQPQRSLYATTML